MKEEKIETNCRSGVTLTLNVGQATPDRKKLLIQRQVSPDLQTANGWMFLPKHCQAKPDLRRGQRGGFTLIELLVVVLIIGILAAVALPQYQKTVMKSRYATMMATADSLAKAEEEYHLANQNYTDDFEVLSIEPTGCTLSVDKKRCTYPWGYCELGTQYERIVCINTTTLNNAHVHYISTSTSSNNFGRQCVSLSTTKNDKYGKLCESMGATYRAKTGLHGVGNNFYWYVF